MAREKKKRKSKKSRGPCHGPRQQRIEKGERSGLIQPRITLTSLTQRHKAKWTCMNGKDRKVGPIWHDPIETIACQIKITVKWGGEARSRHNNIQKAATTKQTTLRNCMWKGTTTTRKKKGSWLYVEEDWKDKNKVLDPLLFEMVILSHLSVHFTQVQWCSLLCNQYLHMQMQGPPLFFFSPSSILFYSHCFLPSFFPSFQTHMPISPSIFER